MEITPLVKDLLPDASDADLKDSLYDLFGITPLLDKHIILLSSGELRKFQLVKTLLSKPKVLILDNPFIGLDGKTRSLLQDLLEQLICTTHLQIILVLSKTDDIPKYMTHVVRVENRTCGPKLTLTDYLSSFKPSKNNQLSEQKASLLQGLKMKEGMNLPDEVVKMDDVTIRYGERVILDSLNWVIRKGEKWALCGDNGSGKSTLLSLICADNPQSYACHISLFGNRRGSGESIWEIKKHIGYVSPEMHRAYSKNLPAIDIVASGLHDTIGLYKRPHPDELEVCEWWMDLFGIADLKNRNYLQLSSGEQRLVLLARAFVKDPELLILDEPLHGLDMKNRQLVKEIIETFSNREGKTLIMVSHYPDELPPCITHTLCLKRHS